MSAREPVTLDPTAALDGFRRWITRSRYARTSQAVYLAKVTDYLRWLDRAGSDYVDALVDEHVRDFAVRDYRRHLMRERRQAVATVELAMAGVGVFYVHLGMGRPEVPRQRPGKGEVRSLDAEPLQRFMRAAERRGSRDWAAVNLMLGCGLRVGEVEALDVDDVFVTDRLGDVVVRHGKGDRQRTVPIGPGTRAALRPWLAQRAQDLRGVDPVGQPLLVSRQGGRLSSRRLQSMVTDIGAEVGVDLSPHDLRHTFGRTYVEQGGDLASLQELLGHASIKTTAGYARPTKGALRHAVETMEWTL